jgi:hypothetical protein
MKTAASREEWPLGVVCAWPMTTAPRLAADAGRHRHSVMRRTLRRIVRLLLAQSGPRWAGLRLGNLL